jgi:hypothetical protein
MADFDDATILADRGQSITLSVFSYSDGTFSGDYEPYAEYPGMNIRGEWNRVTVFR